MCGVNGIFAYHSAANAVSEAELLRTRDHMRARGPDGTGLWLHEDGRVGFGHRRLAIIDLSDRALQPMQMPADGLTIVFNGEIYNFPELKTELEAQGRVFRTTSDTEALLHLYALHGRDMVHRLRGMFAFAIWDERRKGLFLARDPYGIKPLYYANDGWTYRFASQVKALLAGGQVSRELDPAGLVSFHIWGAVQEPFTLHSEIRALPAGSTQWVDAAGPREPVAYASVASAFGAAPKVADAASIFATARNALADSVKAHLLADVEVALFLSAGVDSGALLGLMRDAGQSRIRAVTLSFSEYAGTADDEAPLAAEVARHYGAEHLVRRIDVAEFKADLPQILATMDQPSIDGVNTWFVSKAAAEVGVKVALSGLGGDELLAGYPSFHDIPQWMGFAKPASLVPGLGGLVRRVARAIVPTFDRPKAYGALEYGGDVARAYLLRRAVLLPYELSAELEEEIAVEGLRRLHLIERLNEFLPSGAGVTAEIAALESSVYMRNTLLRDADWAGMAHSVEIRTPLVDWRLLQAFAPLQSSFPRLRGKSLLAEAPAAALPSAVVDRAKTGFTVPTGQWLMNESGISGAAPSRGGASRQWAQRVASGFLQETRPLREYRQVA